MNMKINRFDQEGLAQIGIAFENKEEGIEFEEMIREELEVRVGERISGEMSENELHEFDSLDSDSDVRAWLVKNCPDYEAIIAMVTSALKEELLQFKDRIEGLLSTPELRENGMKLADLGLKKVITVKLRLAGIETYGELSAAGDLGAVTSLTPGDIAEIKEVIRRVRERGSLFISWDVDNILPCPFGSVPNSV